MAGGAKPSETDQRVGATQDQAAGKQARPQQRARVLRPQPGAAPGWVQRCGGRAGTRGGGFRRGVLRGAEPGGRGCSEEPGTRSWRRSVPGGGRMAKDTCRLPGPRQEGASAQRPGAGFLRSGGAGSHAICASAHLRAGRGPWLPARGGREVV